VQIVRYSDFAKLKIRGNARIVTLPDTAEEYCDFYGIKIVDGKAIVYKAIRNDWKNFWDQSFTYEVGKSYTANCDPNRDVQCSHGLHVSHMAWAIVFGRQYRDFRIIECAVPLSKIVVPKNTDGKVRTSELTVLREVPIEEWGLYGKIIAKQRKAQGS